MRKCEKKCAYIAYTEERQDFSIADNWNIRLNELKEGVFNADQAYGTVQQLQPCTLPWTKILRRELMMVFAQAYTTIH